MNVSIGLDIGTTQTKAVAFTDEAKEAASAYFRYPLIQETQGMAEQDQELIFHGVCTVIKEVSQKLPKGTKIQFISFSSAMHSLILLDTNKEPLTRMLTWADNRAADEAEAFKHTVLGQEFYQRTGTPIHPMTPFSKIKWLQKSKPELIQQTAFYVGIKDYIFYRLFGELVCDYGTASGTGYFNIHTFQWDETVLGNLDIKQEQLPKLLPSTYPFNGLGTEMAGKLGLENDISFVLGGADGPLSNLGLGAFGNSIAALTVGTSGALRFISAQPKFHPQMETFCYVLDQTHWVVGGATSNGAGIFDWASQTFLQEVVQEAKKRGENPYDALLSEIAFVPPGANGLIFHPYLLGERAPLWDAEAFGSFIGLQRQHTEKEMMRAVLEGICLNLDRILSGICQEGQLTEIRATGGFAQSPIFRQMMADVLGYPLVFPTVREASALGAVILGWQSQGKITHLSEAQELIQLEEQVAVQKGNHAVYQKIYPLFVSTQKLLANSYQQFAQLREDLAENELT
ncbi:MULTISPECIES: gluconokinase [unclassified Enterococcus]|uniref:gluconokinase n=1 Tax=unclassified Enterococcus TaxID=2608891 RepID=UPI0013ED030F|nr:MULTISPECIES: gluconokinase [unclassified Enterococcus]